MSEKEKVKPCRFFPAGTCRNGDECQFSHQEQSPKPPESRNAKAESPENGKGGKGSKSPKGSKDKDTKPGKEKAGKGEKSGKGGKGDKSKGKGGKPEKEHSGKGEKGGEKGGRGKTANGKGAKGPKGKKTKPTVAPVKIDPPAPKEKRPVQETPAPLPAAPAEELPTVPEAVVWSPELVPQPEFSNVPPLFATPQEYYDPMTMQQHAPQYNMGYQQHPMYAVPYPPPPQLCHFFVQGLCKHGDSCRFSHQVAPPQVPPYHISPPPVVQNQSIPSDKIIVLPPAEQIYSIDVECVATGVQHNDRATAQIALVDSNAQLVLDLIVIPAKPVASYLTPLTGLTSEIVAERGMTLGDAMQRLRSVLPKTAVLVGQNILKDVEWLGLEEGIDFQGMIDLAGLLRIWNAEHNNYSCFSLDHYATVWLNHPRLEHESHNAVDDAQKSVRLFHAYTSMLSSPQNLAAMQAKVLETPPSPSFSKKYPVYEGCCLGNKRKCNCGAPLFG